MQPYTDTVKRIITGPSLKVAAGLEVVDAAGDTLRDISDRLLDGTVKRGCYDTIHGTVQLSLLGPGLDWGNERVRPFMTLSDGVKSQRFDLGVYLLSTPTRDYGKVPETYSVAGYDLLTYLNRLTGQTVAFDAGVNVVDTVKSILTAQGMGTPFAIDTSAATLPTSRIYPLDDKTTWLNIVNDLLGAIGFQGLWVDWRGRYRSSAYLAPSTVPAEWTYDADIRTTILSEERAVENDFFDTPNRWVFIRNDPAAGVAEPGVQGVYVVDNLTDGPSSQNARKGLIITEVQTLDVVDDAALKVQGDQAVATAKGQAATVKLKTDPNPLHWHLDVVGLSDPALGGNRRLAQRSWSLPLSGAQMDHEFREVV